MNAASTDSGGPPGASSTSNSVGAWIVASRGAASQSEGARIPADAEPAKIAYGKNAVANREAENATHRAALSEFRKQLAERHPQLKAETGLMAINGRIEMMS